MRQIAQGGMASVYLARAHSPDGDHTVVVKRLAPQYARDPEFMKMFLDEAQVSVRLHHPNVVRVVEAVSVGSEVLLVLELVRGLSLATILNAAHRRRCRLSPPVVAAIGAQVAAGLHHAHELRDSDGNPMEVIHRDVSPQNIMITREGVAKLLDFGVAHVLGRVSHTNPGVTKGKVGYLSPEQRRHLPIDRRTDIFSLGVVLWEALTGRRLFSSDASQQPSDWHEPVIPAAVYRPTAPELSRTIMRALESNPADRFQTAEILRLELQGFAEAYDVGPPQVGAYVKGIFGKPKVKATPASRTSATVLARPERPKSPPTPDVGPTGGIRWAPVPSATISLKPPTRAFTLVLITSAMIAVAGFTARFLATRAGRAAVPRASISAGPDAAERAPFARSAAEARAPDREAVEALAEPSSAGAGPTVVPLPVTKTAEATSRRTMDDASPGRRSPGRRHKRRRY